MNKLSQLLYFLKFYWEAQTIYNIHSPFLFHFFTNVFDTKKHYYDFYDIELYRRSLLSDNTAVELKDLGAGTSYKSPSRTINQIAKTASSSTNKCMLLHNLCLYFNPQNILELGTNLGLATCYIHVANKVSQLHTIEGDKTLWSKSQAAFKQFKFSNIKSINSSFDEYIESHIDYIEQVDFAYIDGNHTYEATLKYFKQIVENTVQKKVIICDDIYWSIEMMKAWSEIKGMVKNGFTIDNHNLGIVIIDPHFDTCQHIKYISWQFKPFSLGIFG